MLDLRDLLAEPDPQAQQGRPVLKAPPVQRGLVVPLVTRVLLVPRVRRVR